MDSEKHALIILTYKRNDSCCRLYETIESLIKSRYPGLVFIVDDGSPSQKHLFWLKDLEIPTIIRKTNGGISRAKNTALRILRNLNTDVGFIAEDDIIFRGKWWKPYLEAHRRTNIHHFSWGWDFERHMRKEKVYVNSYPIMKLHYLNGCFLSLTQTVIQKVGGFKIMPAKWGHEHVNWTHRIIRAGLSPHFCDVIESNEYIDLLPLPSSVTEDEKRVGRTANVYFTTNRYLRSLTNVHCELEE